MKTLLNNQTNFKIELVGKGEILSCIPWARKTVPPKKSKQVQHSFIHRCGETHGSSDWEFRVLLNGDDSKITIKSTDVTYCLRIAFGYARDQEHSLLVQGVLEKHNCFRDCLLRLCSGHSLINKVLDKRPAFEIARVALPPKLRANGDELPCVLANASIVVITEDSQLEALRDTEDEYNPTPLILQVADAKVLREATHVNDDEGSSVLANASIVTAEDSQLEAPREATHVNGYEGPSILANDNIKTSENSQLETTREATYVNGEEGPSVLANDDIITTEDYQLEATREVAHVNGDEGPSVLANDGIVTSENFQLEATRDATPVNSDEGPFVLAYASRTITTEDSQLTATRGATHVNGDEGSSVLANDSIVTNEDFQLEATREATHVNDDERPSVLANDSIVTTEDSQLEATREATHVNSDEGPFVLAYDSTETTEDSQLEAGRVIDVDGVTSLVLPVAVVDAPLLSKEEQELDHDSQNSAPKNGGRKFIIHRFSTSVKQWRSYRPSSVQKLNGYHIMFLMMIAALFGYYVGLSGVTLDQIHLIIYNRIEAVMCRLMMYVMNHQCILSSQRHRVL